MNTSALKRIDLIQELFQIPEKKIDKVLHYLDSLHPGNGIKKRKSLNGIWKDKGFEKISDIEKEIRKVRKTFQNSILNKTI